MKWYYRDRKNYKSDYYVASEQIDFFSNYFDVELKINMEFSECIITLYRGEESDIIFTRTLECKPIIEAEEKKIILDLFKQFIAMIKMSGGDGDGTIYCKYFNYLNVANLFEQYRYCSN